MGAEEDSDHVSCDVMVTCSGEFSCRRYCEDPTDPHQEICDVGEVTALDIPKTRTHRSPQANPNGAMSALDTHTEEKPRDVCSAPTNKARMTHTAYRMIMSDRRDTAAPVAPLDQITKSSLSHSTIQHYSMHGD